MNRHESVFEPSHRPMGAVVAVLVLLMQGGYGQTPANQLNLAPNASFEQDQKRLGGWLPVGVLPEGQQHRLGLASDVALDGQRSLRIEPGPIGSNQSVRGTAYYADYNGGEGDRIVGSDRGVVGARTVALRLDLNVESIEAAAWVRRSVDQPIVFQAVWTTRRQRQPVVEIQRDSTGEPIEERQGWEKFSLQIRRPAGAIQVQLVLKTSGTGPFHVDAVELFFQRRPERKLLLNQLGFEPGSKAKRVVLQSTNPLDDPPPARVIDLKTFHEVLTIPWKQHGYVPQLDYYYGSADFSELAAEGKYVIIAGAKHARIDSVPFVIQSGLLLQCSSLPAYRFFYEQRCGTAVPGVHAECHMDDGRLPDGTWRDLTGGWHDAGDYNKYNGLTPASIRALTLAYDRRRELFDRWDEDHNGLADIVDEAAWGAEWIDKMLDTKTLELLDKVSSGYRYWGRPEAETDGQPDTQDERRVPSAQGDRTHLVAGYARLGRLLQQSHNPRIVDRGRRYVRLSERLFTKIGGDLLTLRALQQATGEAKYQQRARLQIERWLGTQPEGETQVGTQHFGELARYAIDSGDSELKARLGPLAQERVRELAALCAGPFQVAMRRSAKGELIYCRELEDVNDWYVGETAYRLEVAVEGLLAAHLGAARGKTLAQYQVSWILGCNPAGLSLMESIGAQFVPAYHHRYNTIPGNPRGAVTGAILNGFVRAFPHIDRPWIDQFPEPNADYHANEPWLLQNNRWLEVLAWW